MSSKDKVLQTIVPPYASIPKKNGKTNYTADTDPQLQDPLNLLCPIMIGWTCARVQALTS